MSCGLHVAPTCGQCAEGMGAEYCNGECRWNTANMTCVAKHVVGSSASVSCGNHRAVTCNACNEGYGHKYCNGECHWRNSACMAKCKLKVVIHLAAIAQYSARRVYNTF